MQLTEKQIQQRRDAGRARARQFTSASQRSARKHVKRESLVAAGKRGAERTAELHGYEFLFEKSRRYRLKNPSQPELLMIGILGRMGVKYEREYRLGESLHTTDFYFPSLRLAIEVDGAIHDEGKPNYEKRQQYTKRKMALLKAMEIPVMIVHHSEFDDMAALIGKVEAALGRAR